jgi:hypothetical protein
MMHHPDIRNLGSEVTWINHMQNIPIFNGDFAAVDINTRVLSIVYGSLRMT